MKRTPPPRKALDDVQVYSDEFTAPLNLSNNTAPFPPHPILEEALRTFPTEKLRDYPSLDSQRLREAAARTHGVKASQVLTGNGSNDVLDMAMRAFAEPGDPVAWHPPSFELVHTFAKANGLRPIGVRLRQPGFRLDVEGILAARAKVTFILRPNNPTGNAFPRREVERVLEGTDGLVVLDEAYGDFCGDDFAPDVKDWPNLLVTRTLSKAQGLAGLRIGYAIAQEPVIQALKKVRGPYRLNAVTEHVASVALERTDATRAIVDEVKRERPRVETELRTRGFTVNPSEANFVFFRPTVDAARLHQGLMDRGIAVRRFTQPELRPWLRATVGPAWVTQRFLRDLDDALREVKG